MSDLLKNILAGMADIILFLLLWLVWGVPWYIAFFLSTLAVIGIWWLLAWLYGWLTYSN